MTVVVMVCGKALIALIVEIDHKLVSAYRTKMSVAIMV